MSPEPTAVGAFRSAVAVHVAGRRWLSYVSTHAMRLVMFDIDGTLTDTVKVDKECFVRSLAEACGFLDIETDWSRYEHATDASIFHEIHEAHTGRPPSVAEPRKNHPCRNEKQNGIEFSDHGIGIGIKDQKTIFNKFHRVYNKNIPNVKGTGLGLFSVKEIIKLHGGKISVASQGLNKGTSFIIELPIYKTSKILYIKSLLRQTAKKERFMEASDGD